MKNLTEKKITALKPREKRYTVTDSHGLTLKVQPTGTKSWVLRVSAQGRVSDIFLGHWPEISLMQARQAARRKRKELGQEPPRGFVLRDAWRLWKDLKRGRIVSYQDEKRRMERYIIEPLGSRQIDEISAPLVIHTVRSLDRAGKRATLKRVLMRTREVLDLAVCAGYITHNPVERVSRIFAPPVVTPMPSVHWKELPHVMRVMADAPRRVQVLFLFQLATMLRPGEAASIRKDWIEDDTLTIPASSMKKGREHRVPLTPFALRLLEEEQRLSPHPRSAFAFSGRKAGTHVSAQALAKHLHGTELKGKLVAHGLRSIARSWAADSSVPFEVAEACLSHVVGSKVSRAYQRSDFLEARRSVMIAWSSHVAHCAQSAGMLDGFPWPERDTSTAE